MPKTLSLTILTAILLFSLLSADIASGAVAVPPTDQIDIILNPVEFAISNSQPTFSWQTSSQEVSPPFYHTLYIGTGVNYFDEIILEKYIGTATSYTLSSTDALSPGVYLYQVSADDGGWGYGESQIGSFEVLAEPSIDPLILKYEPILYFHPNEDFYPMNVEPFVENSSLWDSQGADPDQEIKAESDGNPVRLSRNLLRDSLR